MPFQDPVNVSVTKQTTATVREGFGTQLIVNAHAFFRERVRSYSSLSAAAADLTTTSNVYKAISAAFAQSPQPSVVKVGRRNSTTTLTPATLATNNVYSVRVTVNDGDTVLASYTALGGDTAQSVCTALKSAIDAATAVAAHVTATVVGSGASATLTIVAKTGTDEYAVSSLSKLTATFTSTETAADVMTAIDLVDQDYALVTATNHEETFVLGMAAAVSGRKKIYGVSIQNEAVLATLAVPATDTIGKLKELGYENVFAMYSQTADTTFPECAVMGKFSTTSPGTEAWVHKTLVGVPEATALNGASTAVSLSQTQKDNLDARNAMFMNKYRGVVALSGGKTMSGEWIHVTRFSYFIEARSEEVIYNYMINQPSVSHNRNGYVSLRSVLSSEWDKYIDSPGNKQGLDSYVFNFAPGKNVTQAERIAGTYSESATLYLAGAIINASVNINLTYPA